MRAASAGLLVFLICAALLAFPGSGVEPGVVEAEALLAAVLDTPGGGGSRGAAAVGLGQRRPLPTEGGGVAPAAVCWGGRPRHGGGGN